jgi:LacI family transcriptional regulator
MSVSLSELAAHVGLSPSTVSRALNGYADVSKATRQRITEAATRLNYRPNVIARTLATGKTGVVAVVTRVERNAAFDPSLLQLLAGVSQAVQAQGLSVVATTFPDEDVEEVAFRQFATSGFVDGMILARTQTHDARISILQSLNIPFVTYGRTEQNNHAWVDVDNEGVFSDATQRLLDLGHTRFVMLNSSLTYTFAGLREQGVRRILDASKHSLEVRYCETSAQSGYEHMKSLLQSGLLATAILCATDALALGALAALREANVGVGREVSVIGYGNSDAARFASPRLTSIDQQTLDNGVFLGEFLLQALKKVPTPQLTRLVRTPIITRDSDGPAPTKI